MSYSVALVFFHVSLQFHRKSAIELTRGGVVSHSNIVPRGLRRAKKDRQTLMFGGVGTGARWALKQMLHLLLVIKLLTFNAISWQTCDPHRIKKTTEHAPNGVPKYDEHDRD